MPKSREYHNLVTLLNQRGYEAVAKNENYINAVLMYLDSMPAEYTIFHWLYDTEHNYPEDLRG